MVGIKYAQTIESPNRFASSVYRKIVQVQLSFLANSFLKRLSFYKIEVIIIH